MEDDCPHKDPITIYLYQKIRIIIAWITEFGLKKPTLRILFCSNSHTTEELFLWRNTLRPWRIIEEVFLLEEYTEDSMFEIYMDRRMFGMLCRRRMIHWILPWLLSKNSEETTTFHQDYNTCNLIILRWNNINSFLARLSNINDFVTTFLKNH